MNKTACQYAIVRFTPFVETGEFANVGVVVMDTRERYFGFKLETKRYARITQFFEHLDAKLYRHTLNDLKNELTRIHDMLQTHGFVQELFDEITRKRESIIRFSEPRIALTEDPKKKLDELFGHYIERNFVTKQYRETVLETGMRRWLNEVRAGQRFVREKIGDDVYQAVFPFVELRDNQALKAIKPLHLGQDTPSKIIEHGGQWVIRVEELKRREVLPEKVLLTVDGPAGGDKRGQAFKHTVDRLEETGVTILPYQKAKVLEFALDR